MSRRGTETVEKQREINDITRQIIDAAVKVHSHLGPGLLESVYLQCLADELNERGLRVDKEVPLPITYFGVRIEAGSRIDLLVKDRVIIELKSVEEIAPVHKKLLLTYLRLTDKNVGLLLNFNVNLMKDGITRIANGAPELLAPALRLCVTPTPSLPHRSKKR